jgi:hypothetical protein
MSKLNPYESNTHVSHASLPKSQHNGISNVVNKSPKNDSPLLRSNTNPYTSNVSNKPTEHPIVKHGSPANTSEINAYNSMKSQLENQIFSDKDKLIVTAKHPKKYQTGF